MTALPWILSIAGYLAIGVGLARFKAWRVMRGPGPVFEDDLRAEMLGWMFVWPIVLPCALLAAVISWLLFPRSLR